MPPATPSQCQSALTPGQTFVAKTAVSWYTWLETLVIISKPASVLGAHVNGFVFNDVGGPVSTPAITTQSGNSVSTGSIIASSTIFTNVSGSIYNSVTGNVVGTSAGSATGFQSPGATSQAAGQSSLSNGTQVGIGIGVTLAGLAIIGTAAILFFLKRRSTSRIRKDPSEGHFEAHGDSAHPRPPVELWVAPNELG